MCKALMFGSAPIKDYDFIEGFKNVDDLIICADGGIRHVKNAGISPDLIIGDLDSAAQEDMNNETEVIRVPKAKDQTDTELAIIEAVKRGIKNIVLFGCIYGRMDHTFAVIQLLLKYARLGIEIVAAGEDDVIRVALEITVLDAKPGYYLSLFALSPKVEHLTLSGVRYKLHDYTLISGDAVGVSNEFDGEHAKIDFRHGELLIILSKRKEK